MIKVKNQGKRQKIANLLPKYISLNTKTF